MLLNKDGLFKVIDKYGFGFYTLYECDANGAKGAVIASHNGTPVQVKEDLQENFSIFTAPRFIIELKQKKESNGENAVKQYTIDMLSASSSLAGFQTQVPAPSLDQLEGFRNQLKTSLMEETKQTLSGLYEKASIEINTMKQLAMKDLEIDALKREIQQKNEEILDLKEDIRDLERKFDSRTDQIGAALAKGAEAILKGYGISDKLKAATGASEEIPSDTHIRM